MRRPRYPRLVYDASPLDFDPGVELAAYEAARRRDAAEAAGQTVPDDYYPPPLRSLPAGQEALYPDPPDSLDELDPETSAQFREALGVGEPRNVDADEERRAQEALAFYEAMYCQED